jgi:hypothetical protein
MRYVLPDQGLWCCRIPTSAPAAASAALLTLHIGIGQQQYVRDGRFERFALLVSGTRHTSRHSVVASVAMAQVGDASGQRSYYSYHLGHHGRSAGIVQEPQHQDRADPSAGLRCPAALPLTSIAAPQRNVHWQNVDISSSIDDPQDGPQNRSLHRGEREHRVQVWLAKTLYAWPGSRNGERTSILQHIAMANRNRTKRHDTLQRQI